ncbi:dihydrodipicolinate synthase family protein [Vibrio sp. La 4.2.2]|uniref:dihydrodipicolinate synthase family protein n=1 Tax=Vibrio sp. La 4.2.2 TaxID=2998830 RepID=UPI0022CDD9F2|nr:dihydrodipicolinate synthase family protein [Vibrio sp. La 4.2.2]MDA0108490.1 dihydrodipicolinate synthase family protein [Vibrio sp. La 4.2.2]
MIKPQDIYGVNPIVAMPFDDNGEVDMPSFTKLVMHLLLSGCQGVTLFGIASEFYKLSDVEKDELAECFCQLTNSSSVFSSISVTEHSTELAVKRAQRYQQLGAQSLMLLPPHFLKPDNDKIIAHVKAVLSAVSIPVLIQYAPSETGVPIEPQVMKAITDEHDNAVFKIECNPPMDYTAHLLALRPDAVVMNGYAGLYMLDMLSIGGKGVMPGCSFNEVYIAIYDLWQSGQQQQAKQLHSKLLEYISKWMTHCEYIIEVEKVILQKRGLIESSYCRKPNYGLSPSDYQDIDAFILEFRDYFS